MVESGGSSKPGQAIHSGFIEEIDAVRQGNGCFGAWGVDHVVFRGVRASETHCEGVDGRSKPSSGALVFGAGKEGTILSSNISIVNASYQKLCRRNLVWPGSAFSSADLQSASFTPKRPLALAFCWATSPPPSIPRGGLVK